MSVELKRIVCLANSYKPGGRCVAGKELLPDGGLGGWVRPVLSAEEGGVGDERMYDNDTDPEPKVLDIMDVPVLEHIPSDHQTENWLVNRRFRWKKAGRFSVHELAEAIDQVTPLWVDGDDSYERLRNRIPSPTDDQINHSLRLIRVKELRISEFSDYRSNRRRLVGQFRYARKDYALDITDPLFSDQYRGQSTVDDVKGDILMTVSLGGLYHGYCYKLIAAIIEL